VFLNQSKEDPSATPTTVPGIWIRPTATAQQGVWAVTFEGIDSHAHTIAYSKLYKP
jgi:hypothetical protein